MLTLDGLCLQLGNKSIVADMGLTVQAGEIVAVVGPNGAGKSSLFRLLSGEWHASAGDIGLNGNRLQHWSLPELARMRAVMPQSSSLSFPFSVQEVVMLGRLPHDTGREQDQAIVQQVMVLCDVQQFAQRSYLQLSGGERQRVQLARVLAQIWLPVATGPRLLLLDEPTSALDLSHQLELMQVVQRVAAARVAVLVIVHDLNLAARFADRVLVMHQGKMDALGSAQEVMQPDRIARVFKVQARVMKHPDYDCPLIVC